MATNLSIEADVPAHVPPKLVWEHDIDAFARELDDPFVAISRLHDGPELIWARGGSRGQPAWVPTRYALIEEVFMDADRFMSGDSNDASQLLGVDWRLNPLEIDPPAHRAYRQILQPWFQPSAINTLEPMVRSVARELLDAVEAKGRCEFIEDFASLFPSYIFLALMGLPREMLPQFLAWEDAFMRAPTMAERVGAARAIKDYLEDYAEARRSDPRDDLVTAILTAKIDGRPLDTGEIMGMLMVLYLGGLDTVMSSLGWYFRHLADDQALQARLRADPAQIPGAVDDLLRAFGVTGTRRTVTRDMDFHGVTLKAGDWILVPTYLASRDPAAYADPHRIDPARKGRNLTLATGVHNCLGIHLAKREIKVVLEEWLSRFIHIRVPEGETVRWHTDGVWGVNHLPLTWDAA
ncbi:cytochrome P450 [Sphingomonas immobilis]|uniref:Cytochrome P450 n=1 Tax=Sphingomonas immobilis TaxID=3063997 RepID=A0ABT8ZXB4_9SPHN|nr:cytochrome P450 [Sphingomonas sp. CA1-15]MDO7842184.1 cytochrome P450 [Sphingomonas sp. CA1-15]